MSWRGASRRVGAGGHGPGWRAQGWHGQGWHGQGWPGAGGRMAGWHGGPPFRMPRAFALWAPVLVSLAIQVPAALIISHSAHLDLTHFLLLALVALGGPIALIGARRWPGPVVAVTGVLASLDVVLNQVGGPPYIAFGFAIVGAIVRGARVWTWAAIGVEWVATIVVAIVLGGERFAGPRVVVTTLGILIVVGIAEGIRARRDRYREFRRAADEAQRTELQAERVRIARELHDVLAHSLSQINVQAGVGLHLMDRQPDKAKEALASIKDTSKTALEEVRSVLGVLRAENGADPTAPLVPEPGLDRIDGLGAGGLGTGDPSSGGIRVDLDDRLDHADVPQPVQLAIYRIVQESLTNIGRHANGATVARVELSRDDDAYRVRVRDDGRGGASTASESGGRGLLGMRERAELLGGRLTAGPAADGGFEVVAELPARIGAPS